MARPDGAERAVASLAGTPIRANHFTEQLGYRPLCRFQVDMRPKTLHIIGRSNRR